MSPQQQQIQPSNNTHDDESTMTRIKDLFELQSITEIKRHVSESRIRIQKDQEEIKQCARNNYHGLLKTVEMIQKLGDISTKLVSQQEGFIGMRGSLVSLEPERMDHTVKLKESGNPEMDVIIKLARKIKLLVDMPEQIWNALEGLLFLEASQLYRFAEGIYEELVVSLIPPHQTPALKFFPVISSQWDILQNVRSSVSYRARKMIQMTAYNPEVFFKILANIFRKSLKV